jgi:capsular exopolysaccharide synthesis family protein
VSAPEALGLVAVASFLRRPRRPAQEAPDQSLREAYRVLRANLLVTLGDLERPSVMVTSASPGEGKTTTVVGLAKALASSGQRVAVVDFDLRHPDLHNQLGLGNEVGVTEVLLDKAEAADCLRSVDIDQTPDQPRGALYVLTTGAVPEDPAELMDSPAAARLLEAVSSHVDIVLVDSPPVLPSVDVLVLGRLVAGAVLVVEARRTSIPVIERAKDTLSRNQTRLLGVVVNKQQRRDATDPGYGGDPGNERERTAAR